MRHRRNRFRELLTLENGMEYPNIARRDEPILVKPQRTCIGCREVTAQEELVRVALDNIIVGQPPRVVWDMRRRLPGRGAWLHHNHECLNKAQKKGAFNRAFRTRVNAVELVVETSTSAMLSSARHQASRVAN